MPASTSTGRTSTARTNIVLTGFMGTGKTTVGMVLADRTGRMLVDTDALIEERHGPISEIFASRGEEGFRALERSVAAELAQRSGLVIASGGRMLLDPENRRVLEATGVVVCLTATVDELVGRLTADGVDGRPLLARGDPRETIERLLAERAEGYAAFDQVATTGRPPEEIATEVLALVDREARPS